MPECMSGDGAQAVFVGTFLQTGDPVALCDECMVPWTASILNIMTGVDPGPFLAAISENAPTEEVLEPPSEAVGPLTDGDDIQTTDPPPKAKSGRLRAVSSDPPTATGDDKPEETNEAAAASNDG